MRNTKRRTPADEEFEQFELRVQNKVEKFNKIVYEIEFLKIIKNYSPNFTNSLIQAYKDFRSKFGKGWIVKNFWLNPHKFQFESTNDILDQIQELETEPCIENEYEKKELENYLKLLNECDDNSIPIQVRAIGGIHYYKYNLLTNEYKLAEEPSFTFVEE